MAILPNWATIGASVAVGAALAAGPVYLYGRSDGKAIAQIEAATKAVERMQTLEKNNANFKTLSDRDRCIVFMRDSGLPSDGCN